MKLTKTSLPTPLEVAILGYCIWQASDLISSWVTAPAERWAWIAFLIWCLPVAWYLTDCAYHRIPKSNTLPFLGMAIAFALVGAIGSLHLFGHIGLALALAGMLPFRREVAIWLATGIAWLPSFGWLIKALPFALIPIIQISLALAGSLYLILSPWRSKHAT